MSSKNAPMTFFEDIVADDKRRAAKRELFAKTFQRALSVFIAVETVYSLMYIAFSPRTTVTPVYKNSNGNEAVLTDKSSAFSQNPNSASSENANSTDSSAVNNDKNETPSAPSSDGKSGSSASLVGNDVSVIVPYFTAAHNKVKSSAKSATCTYKNSTNYQGVVEAGGNSLLQKIVQSLMNSFLKEETPNTVYSTPEDITANFPPAGAQDNLKASDVKAAKCTEENGVYIIQLLLYPDLNPANGCGSGAVASIITENQIKRPR